MTTLSAARPAMTAARARRNRRTTSVLTYLAALAVGVFSVFPLFWMVLTSVKPQSEIVTPEPVWWPSSFEFDRYPYVAYSTGLTNFELALAMMRLGCVNAYALGSGATTTMAFDGKLLNRPSRRGSPDGTRRPPPVR